MKFILKNLLRRKLRTLFSVLGVGVGVSIMVALFTISDDLVGQISQAFETQRGDIVVMEATAEELESDVAVHYENDLKAIEGVKDVSPMIAALLRTDNDFDDRPAILYYGITGNSPVIEHMKMLEGEAITDDEPDGVVFGWKAWEIIQEKMGERAPKVGEPLNLMDVVTSEGFAEVFDRPEDKDWSKMPDWGKEAWALTHLKELGVHPDAMREESDEEFRARTGNEPPPPRRMLLGVPETTERYYNRLEELGYDLDDPMQVRRMKLNLYVRGVCETGIMLQDSAVWFHLNVAQVIKGKHARTVTETVKSEDGENSTIEREIPASCTVLLVTVDNAGLSAAERDGLVNRVRNLINAEMSELRAIRSEDILQRHKEIEFFEKFGLVISLIAALAGAIGILNTMTLTVYERTREIGLLLAVGWSRKRVLGTVMMEGLLLSIIGGLAGVAFGYAEVQAAKEWFSIDGLTGGLNVARSLHALALAFGIGLAASLYPAIRASLMEPIEALRHE